MSNRIGYFVTHPSLANDILIEQWFENVCRFRPLTEKYSWTNMRKLLGTVEGGGSTPSSAIVRVTRVQDEGAVLEVEWEGVLPSWLKPPIEVPKQLLPLWNGLIETRDVVRKLAESDPKTYVPGQYGISDVACRYCKATDAHPHQMSKEHKSDCLWLQATKLVKS